jgi:hypothetical protein
MKAKFTEGMSSLHCICPGQEIEELMQQIYVAVAKVDMTFALPDLSSALKQIQSQYDSIAARNLQVPIADIITHNFILDYIITQKTEYILFLVFVRRWTLGTSQSSRT